MGTLVLLLLAVDVRGRVVDARTGEPLSAVRVASPAGTVSTDAQGQFVIAGATPGELSLRISLPSYALLKKTVEVAAGGTDVEILLQPDAGSISAVVNVTAGVFDGLEGKAAPSEYTLNKTEVQALGTNLVADPLRSVQALPGVTVADDFRGEISIRGASFERTGIMLDGIYLDGFQHLISGDSVGNERDRGSFSIMPTDRIAEISLLPAAFPARHGFVTGGVVNLVSREGNRQKVDTRISTGLQLGTSVVVDGPLSRRGSFLVGYRSSALDYLRRLSEQENDGGTVFDDGQIKAVFDAAASHRLSLSVVAGRFQIDDRTSSQRFGLNTATKQDSVNGMAVAGWDWTLSPRVVVQTKLFALQTGLRARNAESVVLARQPQTQFGGRQDWLVQAGRHRFEGGTYLRSVATDGEFQFYLPGARQPLLADRFGGSTTQRSFYAQDPVAVRENLTLTIGGRVENDRYTRQTLASPRAGLVWKPSRFAGALRAGFGRHYQFAPLALLLSREGNPALVAERSDHFTLGTDLPLGEKNRLTLDLFRREDRRQIFAFDEPRLVNGRVVSSAGQPLNAVNGRAEGLEVMLQRRSGNRFSGWLSYGWLRTRLQERTTGLRFASDFDQRHTATAFGLYRLSTSWSLSSLWRYGSGQPEAGFFRRAEGTLFLGSQRNQLRLRPYSRVDLRLSKSIHLGPMRGTFVLEGINMLNRGNRSFVGLESFDPRTGRVLNETSLNQIGRGYSLGLIVQF
jgi:hypothetical protein